MQSLMMIAKLNPNTGNYDLWEPWKGTVASFAQSSDVSAVSGAGKSSNTALAGGATYQTANQTPTGNFFVAEVFADQAGTLYVEKLVGSTWYPANGTAGSAVTANVTLQVATRISHGQGYRARFVNGATPNTVFALTTSFTG